MDEQQLRGALGSGQYEHMLDDLADEVRTIDFSHPDSALHAGFYRIGATVYTATTSSDGTLLCIVEVHVCASPEEASVAMFDQMTGVALIRDFGAANGVPFTEPITTHLTRVGQVLMDAPTLPVGVEGYAPMAPTDPQRTIRLDTV